MLPSTLLIASIHQEDLDRQTTIEYLLFGASIVLIYYCSVENIIRNNLKPYITNKDEYLKKICFTKDWCEEYIYTAFCIASLLYTEESINVGACSSHYQEHNFANIRRHSKKDDTHSKFFTSMKYILLERILINKLGIADPVPVSRSDSGRSISGQLPVEVKPLGWYLWKAKRLWRNISDFKKNCVLRSIKNTKSKMSIYELAKLFQCKEEKKHHSISTKSTCMIRTGGLANARIWNSLTQAKDLATEEEYE